MPLLLIFAIFCIVVYDVMVLFFVALVQPKKVVVSSFSGGPKISVVVVFRNEEQHVLPLLNSLAKQSYSNFEVLLVNDASTDTSEQIVEEFQKQSQLNIQLFHLESKGIAPKKEGIELAIQHATGTYIAQTDADCIVPENWLMLYAENCKDVSLLAGPTIPVESPTERSSVLGSYQKLDFLSLQLVTQALFRLKQPILANGANLYYSKQAYLEFYKPNNLASGDDVFLVNTFKKAGLSMAYCPENVVETSFVSSWREVLNQRVRWASKSSKNSNHYNLIVGATMMLATLSFCSLMVLAPFSEPYVFAFAVSKLLVDARALIYMQEYHRVYTKGWHLMVALLINPVLTLVVFVAGFKRSYTWKNRTFSA